MTQHTLDMEAFTIDRSRYDNPTRVKNAYEAPPGLTEQLIHHISSTKNEPAWMLNKRLEALHHFTTTPVPAWGPNLTTLDFNTITYYVKPGAQETTRWEDLPEEIRKTAERIGIPEAEKRALGGAGFQFDSDMMYHNLQQELKAQGVIFENMDVAVQKYPDLVKKYFMTNCVPITDHKFIMLHAAVWSGGTFIYVPPGVKVATPLQAYFRMNALKGGQFEHTLIIADKNSEVTYIEGCSSPVYASNSLHAGCVEIFVHEGARVRYHSVENWSKNTYNLNTKRAIVHAHGTIEWINGNMGSGCTMLYPCSILKGEYARSDSLGIAFAGPGQNQDTGSKVIHAAPHTTSIIRSKSISKGGGISTYRGSVIVTKTAKHTKSSVTCDALLIDNTSTSNTYPFMNIDTNSVNVVHEATVGKIGEEDIYYLMTRGLSEEQALQMVVSGFIEPVVKALPLEYAVELNKLIQFEMEGATG